MSEEEMMDEEEGGGGTVKKFLYVNRRAPYGSVYALESLEVVLIGAAFEQDVSVAFVDDGVYQLKKGQDTKEVDMKNFSPTYRALEMRIGIENVIAVRMMCTRRNCKYSDGEKCE